MEPKIISVAWFEVFAIYQQYFQAARKIRNVHPWLSRRTLKLSALANLSWKYNIFYFQQCGALQTSAPWQVYCKHFISLNHCVFTRKHLGTAVWLIFPKLTRFFFFNYSFWTLNRGMSASLVVVQVIQFKFAVHLFSCGCANLYSESCENWNCISTILTLLQLLIPL